ncbi:uncharacterized protein LOC120257557 [Dioscorea cayenensis subsp. rotundata]|uniref:Uncharacterized protein LOC120257557 n=1 Tax=Dioscorea cayennensis subsp. rotundata TaxID=55577 RepID=A0AB40B2F2_DIOCR|nr:uncharacterized protein LOC120257557 [Dioscorea cayenensis subsp. rotundata]
MQKLLHDGPWSINGIILQLSPWKPFFEPAFAKLNSAAIWVQLHNLPVDFWDGDTLETLTSHIGPLRRLMTSPSPLTRSKFARRLRRLRSSHSDPDTIMISHDASLEPEFGPWMLVARRQGRGRGRSDNRRAGHDIFSSDIPPNIHRDSTLSASRECNPDVPRDVAIGTPELLSTPQSQTPSSHPHNDGSDQDERGEEGSSDGSDEDMSDGSIEPDDGIVPFHFFICVLLLGISKWDTSSHVLRFIRKHKPSLLCLVETRANEDRLNRFCGKLPNSWDWAAILANGYSGGILVTWNKSLGLVTQVSISRHALHLIISIGSANWLISMADDLNVDSHQLLAESNVRYAVLQRQQSIKWAQRAHLQWVCDGDLNTTFFHNSTRIRKHTNSIAQVKDLNNFSFSDRAGIENAFIEFYSNLWTATSGDSFTDVFNNLPNDLPHLSNIDRDFLMRVVTREEVALRFLTSPRKNPDSTVSIFEFYPFWSEVDDHLFEAINFFFIHSVIPASWGRTYIMLIPKKDNPSFVTDYRPISLCNVCYKIITKILANRLKFVLPKLIGIEQAGFVSGHCPFDNIIALQEVVHSLENDRKDPPRMLIKIDVEKAYYTLSWSAILATLTKMNFPSIWISWIKTCISSTSFSFLINGQPSTWIKSTRGVRQGDPISSYLFILVSQNLTSMLNYALRHNLIPGFSKHLKYNFNHLMYVDDLVLITRASRRSARFIISCLNFYGKLTGQSPNLSKSAVYFPSWFNKFVAKRICIILKFQAASFPIKYLGVFISPKRLAKTVFDFMTDNIKLRCSRWLNSKLSPAAKTVLINSSLLSLPIYYLSVYPIYDSTLKDINRIVRRFFWCKNGNGKGIHAVGWNDITSPKTEGGLAIRNLLLAKHSLMAKNMFRYINGDDLIWVDILYLKYGGLNFWQDRFSLVVLGSLGVVSHLTVFAFVPNLRIKSINPNQTSFLFHAWYFEVPLEFKPTYINMDLNVETLSISDFIENGSWDFSNLHLLFGNNFNFIVPNLGSINTTEPNHWIWASKTKDCKISATVYQFLNQVPSWSDNWEGWRHIWSLMVAPRAKHFLWLTFKGRLSTSDYLHSINIGPSCFCALCNTDYESICHLFNSSHFARSVWGASQNQDWF